MPLTDRILRPAVQLNTTPGTVLVETQRLQLRRAAESDVDHFVQCVGDPDVEAMMSDRFKVPDDVEDADEFLRSVIRDLLNTERPTDDVGQYPGPVVIFALPGSTFNEHGKEPVAIGNMVVRPSGDIGYRGWTIGYMLHKSAWGSGYGTEAVSTLVHWLFETWPQLLRVQAQVYSNNPASMSVLKKVGFQQEGYFRNAIEKNGKTLDTVTFGILRKDLGLC